MKIMKNGKLGLFLLLIIICILGYQTSESFSIRKKNWTSGTSLCNERSSCSSCLNNGYDSTGSLCYWCSDRCVNPDDKNDAKYFNSSCSTDKKCSK